MNKYEVSYDLMAPGKNYEPLYARLREHGAEKILLSQWALKTTWTAVQIRDDLRRFIDGNDRLLVAGLTGEAAWTKLIGPDDTFRGKMA